MCGTKRLYAFSDYTRLVRYFLSARGYLLLLFMGQIRGKGVARSAGIQWRKIQWRIYANGANGKVEVCVLSNNLCIIYRHNFYES